MTSSWPAKDDLVLPHDGAAPDRGDADLLLVTGMADAVALEDVLRLVAAGPRRRVGDHQGSAAGSVHLPAVMALHDLDVIAVSQHRGRLFHQLQQYIDPQGHVGGAENGHLQGSGADLGHLLRGVAGGGQHQRGPGGPGEVQQPLQGGGGGEVDDRVRLPAELGRGGEDGKSRSEEPRYRKPAATCTWGRRLHRDSTTRPCGRCIRR